MSVEISVCNLRSGRLCNPRYLGDGVRGWLKDRHPIWGQKGLLEHVFTIPQVNLVSHLGTGHDQGVDQDFPDADKLPTF